MTLIDVIRNQTEKIADNCYTVIGDSIDGHFVFSWSSYASYPEHNPMNSGVNYFVVKTAFTYKMTVDGPHFGWEAYRL